MVVSKEKLAHVEFCMGRVGMTCICLASSTVQHLKSACERVEIVESENQWYHSRITGVPLCVPYTGARPNSG